MSEWWTYTLSDLLMFAPRTYWRLFELYNAAVWPAPIATVALAAALLVAVARARHAYPRAVALLLAAAWAWVGWAFLLERYATINWAARYFAFAFAGQAMLLAVLAARGAVMPAPRSPSRSRVGLALAAFAVFVYPWLGVLAGRPLATAEVVGLAPDPTALATIGLVLPAAFRTRLVLLPVPLAWCAIGGATLWTMDEPAWWVLPAAGFGAVVAAFAVRERSGALS